MHTKPPESKSKKKRRKVHVKPPESKKKCKKVHVKPPENIKSGVVANRPGLALAEDNQIFQCLHHVSVVPTFTTGLV